jgi:putative addiction module component (TIGR02574 family)
MVRSPDTLERELLRLPKADRARLAELLLVSLDAEEAAESPAAVEAAWEAEIARRVAELKAGTVVGIPADQVFAEVLGR